MDKLYIALAALLGGLVAALLGWLESNEPFNYRKFSGSAIRALVAGAVFAAGFVLSGTIGILDLLYAFLGCAGVDVFGNRIAGKFGNGSFPIPKPPETPGEGGS
ncbi:MAG: hypothetical protein Q7R34_09315 [Dehalococcoidia bacterium]|nr:hypothetical protein [Dehalococcoidia bacterium]